MDNQQTLPYTTSPTQGGTGGVPKKNPSPFLSLFLSLFSTLVSTLSGGFSRIRRSVYWGPFWWSIAISVTLATVIAGTMKGSYTRDSVVAYRNLRPNQNGIALLGHSYHMDVDNQTLSIQWEVLGCGNYGRMGNFPGSMGQILQNVGCGVFDRQVDIYFDGEPDPVFSYDPFKFPWASANAIAYIHSLTTFGVDHTVDIFNTDMAPFDTYSFEVYVFVIEPNTNTSVPIVTFAASEAPDNFIISSKEAKVTTNYTYDSGTGPTTIGVDTREASIAVSRTKFSKGLTIGFLLVNWTLSTGSIYIFLVVIFKGEINETVFLFPVTVILTIPALRNLYVGSPPFGIYIDTFGFVVQMITVAVCSTMLVYLVALPKGKRKTSGDDGNDQSLGGRRNVRDSAGTEK